MDASACLGARSTKGLWLSRRSGSCTPLVSQLSTLTSAHQSCGGEPSGGPAHQTEGSYSSTRATYMSRGCNEVLGLHRRVD
jgi:hypothetical protein